jgi:hypothetical protein
MSNPIDERDDALWRGPFESDSPDTSAAAIVRDHAFEPRTERVNPTGNIRERLFLGPNEALCRHCRLAEAAHIR